MKIQHKQIRNLNYFSKDGDTWYPSIDDIIISNLKGKPKDKFYHCDICQKDKRFGALTGELWGCADCRYMARVENNPLVFKTKLIDSNKRLTSIVTGSAPQMPKNTPYFHTVKSETYKPKPEEEQTIGEGRVVYAKTI